VSTGVDSDGSRRDDRVRARTTVRDEVAGVLSAVSEEQMATVAALFSDRRRRWFCTGRGRSGLVAQMVAMRLMHLGFDAHSVGEATAPSVREGDGIVVISGSGETPMTVHVAKKALGVGAHVVAVTADGASTLAKIADAILEVPAAESKQFGGSLFEQGALLVLDALVLDLIARGPEAFEEMESRHTNLE